MKKEEIKKIWKDLWIHFCAGIAILAIAILFHRFGSKRSMPQSIWFFIGVFGSLLMVYAGHRLWKFYKFLKDNDYQE